MSKIKNNIDKFYINFVCINFLNYLNFSLLIIEIFKV